MTFEKSHIRTLIDFRLQKRSKMTSQNDLKTVKKSSRKNNEKNNRKKTPTCEKNLPPPQARLTRAGPSSPLHPPLRSTSWNAAQLSAAFRSAPSRFPSSPATRCAISTRGPVLPPAPPSKIHFVEWSATLSRFPLRSKPLSVIRRGAKPQGV